MSTTTPAANASGQQSSTEPSATKSPSTSRRRRTRGTRSGSTTSARAPRPATTDTPPPGATVATASRSSTTRLGSRRSSHRSSSRRDLRTNRAPSPSNTAVTTGTYTAHPRGFGFVTFDEPVTIGTAATAQQFTSAFMTPPDALDLIADDQVKVRVVADRSGATVTAVLETTRVRTRVFGYLKSGPAGAFLIPDPSVASAPIKLPGKKTPVPNSWVLAEIATGAVLRSFSALTPLAVRTMVFERHNTPLGHEPETVQAAQHVAEKAIATLARKPAAGRVNLSDLPTITIDGPTSRDLDDAISVRPHRRGHTVWVHVADVAAHVEAGSVLDQAARDVATSVYLPSWNRPMLPPALSEQALSLLPGAARDAVTVTFDVDHAGHVSSIDVMRSRIVSDARLTYQRTSAILAGTDAGADLDDDVLAVLRAADGAATALTAERESRSATTPDFSDGTSRTAAVQAGAGEDSYEDAAFTISDVAPSYPTERLIERLMVAANESVAAWLTENALPGVFRVHPAPSEDLSLDLEAFVATLPRALRAPLSTGIGALAQLEEFRTRAQADEGATYAARSLLLRNTSRAVYTDETGAHHGLTSAGYVHFTSPLRRYADLLVHRVVHAFLDGDTVAVETLRDDIASVTHHLTEASGRAARIESGFMRHAATAVFARDTRRQLEAVISGFGPKNAFVTVVDSGLSGTLPFATLTGRWDTDPRRVSARESSSGNVMRIGDRIKVTVAGVEEGSASVSFTRTSRRG